MGLWVKDQRKAIDDLAGIMGVRPAGQALTPGKKPASVSILNLSIMDALVDEPLLPFGELVKSTGLSPKTVRKRLDLLVKTKTISIEPRIGALTDSGDLVYQLLVTGHVDMSEVQKLLGETALTHHTPEPPMKYVFCREAP